jgi:hypothetical protein
MRYILTVSIILLTACESPDTSAHAIGLRNAVEASSAQEAMAREYRREIHDLVDVLRGLTAPQHADAANTAAIRAKELAIRLEHNTALVQSGIRAQVQPAATAMGSDLATIPQSLWLTDPVLANQQSIAQGDQQDDALP